MALGRVEETATLLVIHIRSVGGDQKDSLHFSLNRIRTYGRIGPLILGQISSFLTPSLSARVC